MSTYSKNVWDQLKGTTDKDLVKALTKDGFVKEASTGGIHPYKHEDGRRVTIHVHPSGGGKEYGAKLLKGLLDDIGWSVDDLKRLKLIKKG